MESDVDRGLPAELEGWHGSKGGNGVWQRIISEIPPHRRFVEGFAGGAAVWRHIKPAAWSWLVDRDAEVVGAWERVCRPSHQTTVTQACFLDLASSPRGAMRSRMDLSSLIGAMEDPDTVVYLDPPYLLEARSGPRYTIEMWDEQSHRALLRWAIAAPCRVLISGYWTSLYGEMLQSWRSIRYAAVTRGGLREEWLWMNFPPATSLHDSRFAGANFRERERIKRRRESWVSMFKAMTAAEKQEVLSGLLAVWNEGGQVRS